MAELTTDQVRSLDSTRQRLLALHQSLISLRDGLNNANPVPSWPDLQTHAQLISNNFQSIATQLSASEVGDVLRSTVAFPTPQFPGAKHQNIVETLLRTKPEPEIEDWVKEGEGIAAQQRKTIVDKDRHELWQWAPGAANSAARKQTWGADYTREEQIGGVDKIVTGLRRQLVEPPEFEEDEGPDDDEEEEYEESDEEEEDDENAMEVEQPKPKDEVKASPDTKPSDPAPEQVPFSSLLKFMTTGK